MQFPWQLPHPGLARLGILELNRARFLTPSCGIIFRFDMPSSTYTRVETHAHPCNFFPYLFPEKKCGSQWHISNMAASVTYQRDEGQGQMREVSGGLAIVMVPRNPRSWVVIFAVCIQGRSYVVCQLPTAALVSL